MAQPGDIITVHEGTYHERINPPWGGTSDNKRIVYQAAKDETVVVNGSEIIKGWERIKEDVWNDALDPEIMEEDEILTFLYDISPGILASANWWDWSKKGVPYDDIAVTEMRYFPEDNGAVGETRW